MDVGIRVWIGSSKCGSASPPRPPRPHRHLIQSNPIHVPTPTHTNHSQVMPAGGVDPEALATQIVQRVLPLLAGGAAHRQPVVGIVGGGGGGGGLLLRCGCHGGFGAEGVLRRSRSPMPRVRRLGVVRAWGVGRGQSVSVARCLLFFRALASG